MENKENSGKLIAIETIKKKLLGKKLNYKEVFNLMDEISKKKLNDILTTYFVAASFKEGFTDNELFFLTKAMVETGKKIFFEGIVADKHSTGGVAGTRTTMILVPIIAAAGFKIPKLSSRAITSPAGTADTMEVLAPVTFTPKKVMQIVEKTGGCVVWNGAMGIAPADDIIIKIEEPLAFESFDKVVVSIMAKKVAVGATHLVLDIIMGPTMKIIHERDAIKIANKFKELARQFKIKVVVNISQTFEPAGRGVGPMLEARDVMHVLEQHPERPTKLENKALRLSGKLLDICFKDAKITKNGQEEAQRILTEGKALSKFREIIKEQGGNPNITSEDLCPKSKCKKIISRHIGKIKKVNNFNINTLARILGAPADKQAGIYMLKKLNDKIGRQEAVLEFYASDPYRLKEAVETLNYLPIYTVD